MMTKKVKIILFIAGLLPVVGLVVYGYFNPWGAFGSVENIQNLVKQYVLLAPLVFIGIQILQVVITPINHYVVSVAGGVLFGPWLGTLYNWIGRVIGHLIAFYLSRTFGRRLVKKLVGEEALAKYDKIWDRNGGFYLFLIYFLPLFPDDEISYIVGISKMKKRVFLAAAIFGHIGGSFALAFVGAGWSQQNPVILAIFAVLTIAALLLWIFRKRFEKLSEKYLAKYHKL